MVPAILVGVVFIVIMFYVLGSLHALSEKLDNMSATLAESSLEVLTQELTQGYEIIENVKRIEVALKAMQAEPKKEEPKPRARLRPATASEVRIIAEAEGFEAQ